MLIGACAAGLIGDRFGRRASYQINLAIFGFASLAAVFAPNMTVLIALRFVMGIGLGAEIVVGYGTLAEFIPPSHRGRWSRPTAWSRSATRSTSRNCFPPGCGCAVPDWRAPRGGWRPPGRSMA